LAGMAKVPLTLGVTAQLLFDVVVKPWSPPSEQLVAVLTSAVTVRLVLAAVRLAWLGVIEVIDGGDEPAAGCIIVSVSDAELPPAPFAVIVNENGLGSAVPFAGTVKDRLIEPPVQSPVPVATKLSLLTSVQPVALLTVAVTVIGVAVDCRFAGDEVSESTLGSGAGVPG